MPHCGTEHRRPKGIPGLDKIHFCVCASEAKLCIPWDVPECGECGSVPLEE